MLTIFQDEWNNSERIKNIIQLHTGNLECISFHCCDLVKTVDETSVNLSLLLNNKNVAELSFTYISDKQWQMHDYYCNMHVNDGHMVLINEFKKITNPEKLIIINDDRISFDGYYDEMGFVSISTDIDYWYTDYKNRYNQCTLLLPNKKLDKIWDCGHTTWEWNSNNDEPV